MSNLDKDSSVQETINQISDLIRESQARQKEMSSAIDDFRAIQHSLSKGIQSLIRSQREEKETQQLLTERLKRLITLEKRLLKKNNNLPSNTAIYQSYAPSKENSKKSFSLLSIFKRKKIGSSTEDYCEANITTSSKPPPEVPAQVFSSITDDKSPRTIAELFLDQLTSTPNMLTNDMFMSVFRNFIIQYDFVTSGFSDYQNINPELVDIATTIAENYSHVHFFLKRLKVSAHTNEELVFEFQKRAIKASSLVMDITKKLITLGYFEKYEYQKSSGILRVVPSNKVAYNQFITGRWLEIYANKIANMAVKLIYDKKNVSGLVLSNVKIAHPSSKCIAHEFDSVIITPNQIYFIECKTGEYQSCLSKYRKIAEEFNLPPNSIIIAVLSMEEEECQKMSRMYHMVFCNQITLYATLLIELKSSADKYLNQNSVYNA